MDDATASAFSTGLRELNDENERLRFKVARYESALELIGQFLGDVDGQPFYPDEYARRVLAQEHVS